MSYKYKLMLFFQNNLFCSMIVSGMYSLLLGFFALRFRLRFIGKARIAWSAKITGWKNCEFGDNTVVGARTWININDRSATRPSLMISDNSFIGQDNFITVGKSVRFGEFCLTARGCSFIGSSHIIDDPFSPYLTTGTTNEHCIYIGANCFFGFGSAVIGNVSIGHGSIVGAHSIVMNNVPPFSIVAGNPAKIIKRYDFKKKSWVSSEDLITSANDVLDEAAYTAKLGKGAKFPFQPVSAAFDFFRDV